MLRVVADDDARADMTLELDEICREGARRMLAAALEAERDAYLASFVDDRDEDGRRLVVGNGHARPRVIATGAGPIEVEAPRVNDKRVDEATGERRRFRSRILAPWCRKSPKVSEVLPLMYLHGMSSGDFAPALAEFFGSDAGLSPSVITRLTKTWQEERERFAGRSLAEVDYVYCWADGVHFNVRLEEERLCCLVIVGVRADGTKELVAIADGYRESTGSWEDLLRDTKRRGMRAPVVMVGDGALGMWSALGEVFPETRHQRCWVHKVAKWCPRCRNRCTPPPAGPWPRSATPRTGPMRRRRSRRSPRSSGRNGPRRWPRSSTTPTYCSPSSTSPPNTGSTSRPPTRSSRPSPPCA